MKSYSIVAKGNKFTLVTINGWDSTSKCKLAVPNDIINELPSDDQLGGRIDSWLESKKDSNRPFGTRYNREKYIKPITTGETVTYRGEAFHKVSGWTIEENTTVVKAEILGKIRNFALHRFGILTSKDLSSDKLPLVKQANRLSMELDKVQAEAIRLRKYNELDYPELPYEHFGGTYIDDRYEVDRISIKDSGSTFREDLPHVIELLKRGIRFHINFYTNEIEIAKDQTGYLTGGIIWNPNEMSIGDFMDKHFNTEF